MVVVLVVVMVVVKGWMSKRVKWNGRRKEVG